MSGRSKSEYESKPLELTPEEKLDMKYMQRLSESKEYLQRILGKREGYWLDDVRIYRVADEIEWLHELIELLFSIIKNRDMMIKELRSQVSILWTRYTNERKKNESSNKAGSIEIGISDKEQIGDGTY